MRWVAGLVDAASGDRVVNSGVCSSFVLQEPEPTGATILDWVMTGGAEHYTAEAELWAFQIDPETACTSLSGGEKRRAALAKAGSAIFGVLTRTMDAGCSEIQVVSAQDEIVNPSRVFEAEQLDQSTSPEKVL